MIRLVLLFTIFFTNLAFAQDNFLVIVADDVGVDKVTVYGEGVNPPATPNIDGLAADGVLFRNAWASPLCSTSRVSTLTGKYAFRHGTGKLLGGAAARKGLDPQVTNIANVLKSNGYDTAAFGKWHMRGCSTDPNGDCDGSPSPTLAESAIRNGFDYFAGNLGNVGPVGDYCDWNKTEASRTGPGDNDIASTEFVSNDYLTTVTTDDAISHMSTMTEPWFSWVAYNASHAPYHEIPSPETNCTLTVTGDNTAMFDAMTEKMDSEIGRLLASLDPAVRDRTTIIFIGDNGTPGAVVVPPFTKARSKATVYEGGVGVPFIVVGPDVATPSINQESQALVHVVDIFDTVMDIAGLDPCNGVSNCAEDSISFLPSLQDYTATSSRTLNFSETFSPNQVTTAFAYPEEHEQAISDGQFKIVRFYDRVVGTTEFYDLSTDAFESTDLLTGSLDSTQTAAFNALASSYTSLTGICLDLNDLGGDCVNDTVDNCPAAPNGPREVEICIGNQWDTDNNGVGNGCDVHPTGPLTFSVEEEFKCVLVQENFTNTFEGLAAGTIMSNVSDSGVIFPAPVEDALNPCSFLDLMIVEDLGDNPAFSGVNTLGVNDPLDNNRIAAGTALEMQFSTEDSVSGFGMKIISEGLLSDGDLLLTIPGNTVDLDISEGVFLDTVGGEDYYSYFIGVSSDVNFTMATLETSALVSNGDFFFNIDDVAIVPEPNKGILLLAGFPILFILNRKRNN